MLKLHAYCIIVAKKKIKVTQPHNFWSPRHLILFSLSSRFLSVESLMACCCGGESDDSLLTDRLLSNSTIESQTLTLSSSTVLSPMNSNFAPLSSHDVLRSILELLSPPDLARASCVCRLWRDVASDREMLEGAFKRPWKVGKVVGVPSSTAFWRHPGLDRYAISHRLRRSDTVPGLALKYSVQVISFFWSSDQNYIIFRLQIKGMEGTSSTFMIVIVAEWFEKELRKRFQFMFLLLTISLRFTGEAKFNGEKIRDIWISLLHNIHV